MLLVVDIGNSSTKFGVFDEDRLTVKFSVPTKRDLSAAEIAVQVDGHLSEAIDAAIVSSVVPEMNAAVSDYLSHFLKHEPRFVKTADDFGLTFNHPIDTIGTDRLVNSFAATDKYGVPVIVISFGTATTIDVIDKKREHLGGVIAPGPAVMAKALALAASKLPAVDLRKPEHIIGKTTESAIQSGVVLGHIAMIEGLLKQAVDELGDKPKIVATGGNAEFIAPEIGQIDTIDENLTLEGLRLLCARRPQPA
jgi:type III pantothenate kinase